MVRPPPPGAAARGQPAAGAAAGSSRRAIAEFVRFLACWQHVAAGPSPRAGAACSRSIEQLQGIEVAAGEWERHVLPARVVGYDPRWLDELCLSGEVAWGRLTPRPEKPVERARRRRSPPPARRGRDAVARPRRSHSSPRQDLRLDARRLRPEPASWPSRPPARRPTCWPLLREQGACFRSELPAATGRLPDEVDEGLWDLVARGFVTADAFSAVRSLLAARATRAALPDEIAAARSPPLRPCGVGAARSGAGTGRDAGRSSPIRTISGAAGLAGPPERGTGRGGGLAAARPVGRGRAGSSGRASPTGCPGAT